ncbi:MAG: FAD-dependent oxidoreductase [Burkholderiaceae bacterium]|nr:FAD-dependent oxidoreductase [Burkholderiaceae bacterium]
MAAQHIGIAGAGLLGRLLAWRLSTDGHAVTVFDPARGPLDRGQAAGWTAAGMLSPWAELETADAHVASLGLRSLVQWADTVGRLPMPVLFRRDGSLLLAHRSDLGAAQRLVGVLQSRMPPAHAPRALAADALHELEPAVHGPTHAWMLDGEGQIHSVQAMLALADAATRRGTRWRWGTTVHELAPGRIDGERFDAVFDVRGVGARPDLPVRGVRGEILWLHAPGLTLHRPLRLLHPRSRVYLVPRPDDIVVVGASEIESEDRSPISVRSLLGLLSAAHSVLPELAEARVVHTETNLRPALPDNLPHIEHRPGLTRINGLFRHGWLIAPALVEDALRLAGLQPLPAPVALQGLAA